MPLHKTTEPTTSAKVSRLQDVRFGGQDIPRNTASHVAPQQDLATRIVAARFGLPFHRAVLVCQMAGIGGGRP
jgi:hypothetical protein